jgi:hypothetical protein
MKKDTDTPKAPPVKDHQARQEAERANTALKNVREGYGHGTNEREGDKSAGTGSTPDTGSPKRSGDE